MSNLSFTLLKNRPISKIIHSIKGDLRTIEPYLFEYNTHVKERWVGKSVDQVIKEEMTLMPSSDVKHMFEAGHIFLNHQQAQPNAILKLGDVLCSRVYRKDPDVLADIPAVIFENKQFVAFHKPPSIPVHPNSKCVANTVLEILRLFTPYTELYPVHRLDALTQGVLIFAKSTQSAALMSDTISSYKTGKIYFARVLGHFTSVPQTIKSSLRTKSKCGNQIDKEAQTYFKCLKSSFIHSNPVSILRCEPKTGRFHQIRKHLASIQHPIINDPLYNPIWEEFVSVSRIHKCVAKPTVWPLYKPPPPFIEEEKLMSIDLFASAYHFPTLNLKIEVPLHLWPEWAKL